MLYAYNHAKSFKIMRRFILLTSVCLLWLSSINAQSQKALARLNRDAQTTMKYKEYATAIDLYKQLLRTDPENLDYNYQIGVCYLNSDAKKEALEHLQKVYDKDPDYNPNLEFNLGQAYHYMSDFSEAKKHYTEASGIYQAMKGKLSSDTQMREKEKEARLKETDKLLAESKKRIEECEHGLTFEGQPINATIENLGTSINTEYPEYTPLIPKDTSFMVFTSRRETTTGGKRDFSDDLFFEDIYVSVYSNERYGSPKQLEINKKYHDAAAALSPDGKTLYLYRDDRRNKGDLYVSEYDEGNQTWNEPKKLNNNINTKFQETSLCLSPDGNTMYFASDREGGQGGLDIYVSKKDANGEWGPAENIGDKINTSYDDDAPFITFDGKTFYFSSKGHNSMGGFDIFKAELLGDKQFGDPQNLGFPINSPDDDVHLVLTVDNRKGYYVSSDDSGEGREDIYTLTAPKTQLTKLNKEGLTLTQPGDLVVQNNDNKIPQPNFSFKVRFGFDQSALTSTSKESIDNLLQYLNDNQTVRIELSGHTCNIGTQVYNQALSQRRARSVANYLIERGIDANRIEVKGYAYEKPLEGNKNSTPAERAENRRAEYMILEE